MTIHSIGKHIWKDNMKEQLAKIITESTLWNIGKDGHNALSELVESIYAEMKRLGGVNASR